MNEDWKTNPPRENYVIICEIIERIENKSNEVAVLFEEKESAVGKENSLDISR